MHSHTFSPPPPNTQHPTPLQVAFHEHECINRIVTCPAECGARLLMYKELEHHAAHECGRRITKCVHCDVEEEERFQTRHFQNNCAHRYIDCVIGCGKQIKVIDMRKHIKFCIYRYVCMCVGCFSVQ